ncbi:hypothetical protein DFA_02302 [Cavenderia fasciculata]|uniref:Solute carrier family 40 member n=1 Tax=Cavenderia fasciculata TaxID=261658 RepID=F4PZ29_CACFS|nr:uncharacterized protein DFA_02302 [Cavenderia fasciculata]EGG19058.1 hypothetical protein DFA_02302 [Cavenderia fasciculata]|eukprot:XP_004366691.1 hypothetical protein DFA_02302 [Cavenderia fasciculata]
MSSIIIDDEQPIKSKEEESNNTTSQSLLDNIEDIQSPTSSDEYNNDNDDDLSDNSDKVNNNNNDDESNWLNIKVEEECSKYMLISHFITRMGDRGWEFVIPLILIYISPNSLIPTTLFGLSVTIVRILFGTTIGHMTDNYKKLLVIKVGIIGQLLSIGLSCIILFKLVNMKNDDLETRCLVDNIFCSGLSSFLFFVLLTLAGTHSVSSLIMDISVERKWVPAICKKTLSKTTSRMKQVDLSTEVLAPFIAGLIATFYQLDKFTESYKLENNNSSTNHSSSSSSNSSSSSVSSHGPLFVFMIIGLFNFFSFAPQYFFLHRVESICRQHSFNIDSNLSQELIELQQPNNQINNSQEEMISNDIDIELLELKKRHSLKQVIIENIIIGEWNPLRNIIKGWRTFIQQERVYLMILAYVCLWFTLLSPHDPILTAYLSTHGYNYLDLSIFRGLGALFGLAATFSYTPLMRRFGGLNNTATFYIFEESVLIFLAAILFSWIESSYPAKYIFLVLIVLSRCGLYGFEICEINYVQRVVPDNVKGIVSGFESSLTNLAMLIN